jgi:hypothetical protein
VQLQQVLGLVRLELRLLSAQPALGLGYFHPFLGAQLGVNRHHVAFRKPVRAWAASNGIQLSSRGRVPISVLQQYRAAGN